MSIEFSGPEGGKEPASIEVASEHGTGEGWLFTVTPSAGQPAVEIELEAGS